MKSRIVEQLGHTDILLPSLIAEGLAANDRVKVRLSALQAAAEHARKTTETPVDLAAECRAAGIDPTAIQSLVTGAGQAGNGRIAAPGLASLSDAILCDVATMVRAVEAGAPNEPKAATDRLSAIKAQGALRHDGRNRGGSDRQIDPDFRGRQPSSPSDGSAEGPEPACRRLRARRSPRHPRRAGVFATLLPLSPVAALFAAMRVVS
jgi:hypothetical protein